MSEPFIGEIITVSFNFAPKGWALCNGSTIAIAGNKALFSLLGTTFGGDGDTTFTLPDLQGRAPLHTGSGAPQVLGESAGEEAVTLTTSEMAMHIHYVSTANISSNTASPSDASWGIESTGYMNPYRSQPVSSEVLMNPAALGQTGGSESHNNMAPFLTVAYCIALVGVFPSRN